MALLFYMTGLNIGSGPAVTERQNNQEKFPERKCRRKHGEIYHQQSFGKSGHERGNHTLL
jgi:hypothetical protein